MNKVEDLPKVNGLNVVAVYRSGVVQPLVVVIYPSGAKTLETPEGRGVELFRLKGWVYSEDELTEEDRKADPIETLESTDAVKAQLNSLYESLQFFIDRRNDGDTLGEHVALLGLIGEKKRLGDLLGKKEATYTVTINKP